MGNADAFAAITRDPNCARAGAMDPAIVIWIVYALWGALIVYLTVAAFGANRDTEQHLSQSLGLMFAIIAAFLLPHLPAFDFVNYAPVRPVLSVIGILICLAGMALLVAARQALGPNWSQTVSAKEGHELVMSGPYRYVRHPMYTGGLIAALGSAIVVGGPFVFLLLLLGSLFLWRVRAEDRLMVEQFPAEYPAYMQRTKALIPLVW
jgi:protein-S-isoprenylcysteine O-methyltransferase Ste14